MPRKITSFGKAYPPGRFTSDARLKELCATLQLSATPTLIRDAGRTIVAYERSRMWIDRNAWEMLPPDGILVVRIRQPGRPIHLCMSLNELETAFADVKESRDWDVMRHYHWPRLPRAAYSFVLEAP